MPPRNTAAGKAKAGPKKATDEPSLESPKNLGRRHQILLSVAVLALAALLKFLWGGLPHEEAPPLDPGRYEHFSNELLRPFSSSHNASFLWGTYRPGVLFGLKTRTWPEALVAGLMWTSVSANDKVDTSKLRHTCEESETRQGLQFGFSEHDGRDFGKQTIKDPQNDVEMSTAFWKRSPRSWTARVEGSSKNGARKVLYFYMGLDEEFVPEHDRSLSFATFETVDEVTALTGATKSLGKFRLSVLPSDSGVVEVVPLVLEPGQAIAKVKEALVEKLSQGSSQEETATKGKRKGKKPVLYKADTDASGSQSSTISAVQIVVSGDFSIDFVFGDSDSDSWGAGARSSTALAEASAKFEKRFDETFQLRRGPFSTDAHVRFAQAALSAMLGGLGYFYGPVKVKSPEGELPRLADPRPLFTGVPSRSFFPRGFLWDEGFHQLLISKWDPELSMDVISHWFNTMRIDGWIPREQIRGAEAVAKVPDWAIPQHPSHANPPTFLLAIEAILTGSSAPDVKSAWFSAIFPAVERWFQWFASSQKGVLPDSFRWHGRDPKDGKLNAMTLSSGLDDYPRAAFVTDEERHVDLHSWIAFGAGLLAELAQQAGLRNERVEEYKAMHQRLLESLDKYHWDAERKKYNDFGLHSNKGKFAQHVVVKCGKSDGSDPIEHTVALDHFKQLQQGQSTKQPCPPSHPKFLFPLGDGRGGLMMREKFVSKGERLQFVDHTGYISLFPLLLRLLPPDSERLGLVLDLLDPARGLWSDWGLRSLAKGDPMYLRDNAPGDAPYWRGPIWINCNFLALAALRHYSAIEGPWRERAAALAASLSSNLVENIKTNFEATGFLWEQYNPESGVGQRT
eukprot:CAMPEP_0206545338 /NCGR_PEP_ID=MMETSP0325_2-20121206/12077_1 /ASSEMBLY_ACC=CAM_ASM_000347 /TAXON_ID=2866 /ORGANISM="Crypthecodinium cohnii, Strain Seligo" /LENGTH=850 /DNA_ID=CAMNT_0054044305 /DNA_START=244 /DNA_END=2792 /DNA_ORIENTATION=-